MRNKHYLEYQRSSPKQLLMAAFTAVLECYLGKKILARPASEAKGRCDSQCVILQQISNFSSSCISPTKMRLGFVPSTAMQLTSAAPWPLGWWSEGTKSSFNLGGTTQTRLLVLPVCLPNQGLLGAPFSDAPLHTDPQKCFKELQLHTHKRPSSPPDTSKVSLPRNRNGTNASSHLGSRG